MHQLGTASMEVQISMLKPGLTRGKLYREMHIVAASSSLPMPVTAKLERG